MSTHAEKLLFERMEPQGDWVQDAVCAEVDSALFFPPPNDPAAALKAKRICAVCPARIPCGEWALRTREPHGVWGGMSEKDRARARGAA